MEKNNSEKENSSWNDVQSEIIPNFLYLGSQKGSENKEWLVSKGIKKILSLCESLNRFEEDFEYLKINVNDTITQNIDRYFETTNEFIGKKKKRKIVKNSVYYCFFLSQLNLKDIILLVYIDYSF